MDIPDHPDSHGWFDLPRKAGKDLIAKAISKIPGVGNLMSKLYSRQYELGQGLPKHQYNDGGKLQWAYLNT